MTMNNAIKYLVIPSLCLLATPFLVAAAGLIDFESAGGILFYIMIAVGIANGVLYKKLAKQVQKAYHGSRL